MLSLPGKEATPPRQWLSLPEAVLPRFPRPLLSFPWKEATPPRQWLSLPEAVLPRLPRPLLSFPGKEAVPPRQLLSLLGKAVLPRQLLTFLWVKEAILPRPLPTFPSREGGNTPQAGPISNQARVVRQKQIRQSSRWSNRHRAPQASQENGTISWEDQNTITPQQAPQGSSQEEPNPKWVINLSNKPLTQAQRFVLAKGPNFAVTPRQPPHLEYITAIEAACTKLSQQDAEELRADINRVLR